MDGVRILGNFSLECGNQGNGECWVPLIITVGGPNCTVGYVFQTVSTPRNVRIIWYLNLTSGYAFDATNGIAITNNNGAFAGGGHNGGRPYQFHWQSSPVSSAQSRSYDIRVKHEASGNFCSFVDPLIVNRG